jgi:hypothetical protein
MNSGIRSLYMALLVATLVPGVAVAADSHLAEAISHTREAVVSGREGKPAELVHHATEALHHAKDADRERPEKHTKAAIRRLKEAVKFGEKRRSAATRIAERALQELERAPQ